MHFFLRKCSKPSDKEFGPVSYTSSLDFPYKAASRLVWLKVKFFIVMNLEFKYFTSPEASVNFNWMMTDDVYDQHFCQKKSKILRFDAFLT
jgi:hypothetical protein